MKFDKLGRDSFALETDPIYHFIIDDRRKTILQKNSLSICR